MASKINDYIKGFFACFHNRNCNPALSYDHNECFNYFFKIREYNDDILGAYYLVPAFLYEEIKHYKNTNIPVQIDTYAQSNLSETSLLSALGKSNIYYSRNHHMKKLTTKSGEVYYGTNGIILDSNFDILIMVVLKVINNNIIDALCYINPKVFLNEKGTAEKIIIKKILPLGCTSYMRISRESMPVTFIFKDVTRNYMYIPREPEDNFCDDYVNNKLIGWEDEIIDYLEEHFLLYEQEN